VLYDYTARHWGEHACGPIEEIHKDKILEFLQDEDKVVSASQVILFRRRFRHPQAAQHKFYAPHTCAYFGLHQTFLALLDLGAKADMLDSTGRTPLSWAAEMGHDSVVKMLLARDDVKADSKDDYGRTPLFAAADMGHEEVVKLLVTRKDVDVQGKDMFGQTPLSRAASQGHESVVKLLLERGAVVDTKDVWGQRPLSSATAEGHDGVVKVLLAHNVGQLRALV
jgi:ankyrin repeat protein